MYKGTFSRIGRVWVTIQAQEALEALMCHSSTYMCETQFTESLAKYTLKFCAIFPFIYTIYHKLYPFKRGSYGITHISQNAIQTILTPKTYIVQKSLVTKSWCLNVLQFYIPEKISKFEDWGHANSTSISKNSFKLWEKNKTVS